MENVPFDALPIRKGAFSCFFHGHVKVTIWKTPQHFQFSMGKK